MAWQLNKVNFILHSLPSIQPKSALEVWASITFCRRGMEVERDPPSLPFPSPLSSPSVKTWPAGYKTTWNSILDCWMFRHMRMPNQLTYKGKKTTCTHQLKVRLHHIEIENRQCYKWILLTFWSLTHSLLEILPKNAF